MSRVFFRAWRAAKLDASLFDEVMADAKAMTQAIIVVFIYGAAVAYGTFGRAGRRRRRSIRFSAPSTTRLHRVWR